jgi:hypothetical protein
MYILCIYKCVQNVSISMYHSSISSRLQAAIQKLRPAGATPTRRDMLPPPDAFFIPFVDRPVYEPHVSPQIPERVPSVKLEPPYEACARSEARDHAASVSSLALNLVLLPNDHDKFVLCAYYFLGYNLGCVYFHIGFIISCHNLLYYI